LTFGILEHLVSFDNLIVHFVFLYWTDGNFKFSMKI